MSLRMDGQIQTEKVSDRRAEIMDGRDPDKTLGHQMYYENNGGR